MTRLEEEIAKVFKIVDEINKTFEEHQEVEKTRIEKFRAFYNQDPFEKARNDFEHDNKEES